MFRRKRLIIGIISIFIVSIFSYLIIGRVDGIKKDLPVSNNQVSSDELSSMPDKEKNLLELEFSSVNESAPPAGSIVVDRALICLDVCDRMPVQEVRQIAANSGTIFCWTMFLNGDGKKIRYIWHIGNDIMASQWLSIKSNKFRAWCPKNIDYKMIGNASVDIVDEQGRLLKTIEFEIIPSRISKLHAKYS